MVGKYQKVILENGLRLITVPMKTASVTVLLLVGTGSRYESADQSGLSHFLEHMAFKGTKKRPSTLEIASTIEGIGGVFNAFTSKDQTGYFIKAAAKHLPLMIDILSDMLLNSLFKEEEIEREKGVIIEEINMYEDTPARKVGEEYERLLYGETPLGRDVAGEKEVIRRLTRDDFIDYMDKFYGPNNCVLAVAGGIDEFSATGPARPSSPKNTLKGPLFGGPPPGLSPVASRMLVQHLGSWQSKKIPSFKKMRDAQSTPAVRVITKKTEQVHLCLGVRAINLTDPRRYVMSLLTVILGGGMSSRLFSEVREKRGLAYYIKSETSRYQDVGNFLTQAGVDLKKIEEAVKVILKEYHDITILRYNDMRRKELERAKEFVKGNLILSLEDSKTVASLYGGAELLEGKIRTPEEIIKALDAVTVEEITALAREIFLEKNLNLVVIGPFERGIDERLRDMLKL